ncbi:MAG: hypothetical protein LRY40_05595 [Shewanella fodinae]|nr:hypothetical protein [Shewanella fodinae]
MALLLIYDAIPLYRKDSRYLLGGQLLSGSLIGGICIAVMLTPWTFSPGVIFDSRSVLLCMTGLFFGGIPTLLACVIASLFRIYLGGEGAFIGVGVIWTSGIVGISWRKWRNWNRQFTDSYRSIWNLSFFAADPCVDAAVDVAVTCNTGCGCHHSYRLSGADTLPISECADGQNAVATSGTGSDTTVAVAG